MLYWLKPENAPGISAIAKAIGHHHGTVQEWLATVQKALKAITVEVGERQEEMCTCFRFNNAV